jgi:hypothetical protein
MVFNPDFRLYIPSGIALEDSQPGLQHDVRGYKSPNLEMEALLVRIIGYEINPFAKMSLVPPGMQLHGYAPLPPGRDDPVMPDHGAASGGSGSINPQRLAPFILDREVVNRRSFIRQPSEIMYFL